MDTTETIDLTAPKTLLKATRVYSDLDYCVRVMAAIRWKGEPICPHCGGVGATYISTRRIFKCKIRECRKQFSVKAGTIFADSPIGLDKWLIAIWLLASCKNGISSYELHRDLGVTQKTAWFMLHRIRVAMQTGSMEKFDGEVEADETFIGGLAKNMHKDVRERKITGTGGSGKAVVLGLLKRGEAYTDKRGAAKKSMSKVKATVVADRKGATLRAEVAANVVEGSAVYTDSYAGYRDLNGTYDHRFIDHAVTYAENQVSTNGLENFWTLTKRTIKGTYVSVEPEHLEAYLDEQAFRFNERDLSNDGARFVKLLSQVSGKRLTYRELIGDPQGIDSPDPLRGGPRAD